MVPAVETTSPGAVSSTAWTASWWSWPQRTSSAPRLEKARRAFPVLARPWRPEDALRTGRPVALDAMSATERKVVHEHLKDREDVETYSEGTEPERHLVVAPLPAP